MEQLRSGHVYVSVENVDTKEIDELDDIGEEPSFNTAELGFSMIATAAQKMSAHQRLELLARLHKIIGA